MEKENVQNSWIEKLKPFLDTVTGSLLNGLEAEGVVTSLTEGVKVVYRLNLSTDAAPTNVTSSLLSGSSFEHLFELRNTLKAVYGESEFADSSKSHDLPISKLLERLEQHGSFKIKFENKAEVLKILDSLDHLSGDAVVQKSVLDQLDRSSFRPNILVNEMLAYFGYQKVKKHLSEADSILGVDDSGSDLRIRHPQVGKIDFIFKIRRGDPLPDNQTILSGLRLFERKDSPAFVLLIIFTHANSGGFPRLQYQFRQMLLNEFKSYAEFIDRVKFMPIWTSNLPLLDQELENFKRTHIADSFRFEFKAQPVPRGFPDRNDHFLDRTFELGKTAFHISIDPGETKFWRFGLRMVRDDNFPPLTEGRHSNEDVADVHLCVGEPVDPSLDPLQWDSPNVMQLTHYHVDVFLPAFKQATDYKGEVVKLMIQPIGDFMTAFHVLFGDRNLGQIQFVTRHFKYCRLGAWCDRKEFSLKADINVRFLGLPS
jgi:hypothetical protein